MVIQTESMYISYFMDLKTEKKTCGSKHTYCLKSGIHTKLVTLSKLVTLIKMCFKASYNKVCIGNMVLTFPGWNGLNPIHLKPTAFQFCFISSQVKKKSDLKKIL